MNEETSMPGPMICPRCKIPMNHHAEKLIDPRDEEAWAAIDPRFGAVLEEVHTCPSCGMEGVRRGS